MINFKEERRQWELILWERDLFLESGREVDEMDMDIEMARSEGAMEMDLLWGVAGVGVLFLRELERKKELQLLKIIISLCGKFLFGDFTSTCLIIPN